jgi:hypothetical protein
MPVSHEWRFFARDGEVKCWHPYWFEDALEEVHHKPPLPEDWKKQLAEMYSEPPPDKLKEYAETATKALTGYWSIDFLESGRTWYLTDMAIGEASYHYPHRIGKS